MNKPHYFLYLKEVCSALEKAKQQLEFSYQRCKNIRISTESKESDLIEYEALCSRFGRLVDLLIHKFFRTLDLVELTEGGSLLDVIHRGEKRGLIDQGFDVRALKDLRNEIVQDYLLERLNHVYREIFERIPKLLEICQRCLNYASRYAQQ